MAVVPRSVKGIVGAMAAAAVALSAFAATAPEPEPGFHLPLLEGWRPETIPFPLSFAPELEYEGIEELRFAPGMFEAESEELWTYAFIWWVPAETEFEAARLGRDLEAYFRGLSTAVAESRGATVGEARFAARLEAAGTEGGNRRFEGRAESFDAFVSQRQIELNVRIELLECPDAGKVAAFFELSPQPPDHTVWESLAEIRQGFRCP